MKPWATQSGKRSGWGVALMSPRLLANLFPAGLKSSCGQGNACPAAQILRLARRLGESSWQVTLRNLPLIVQFRSGNSVSWDSWTLIVCHKIAENCCEMSFLTRLFFLALFCNWDNKRFVTNVSEFYLSFLNLLLLALWPLIVSRLCSKFLITISPLNETWGLKIKETNHQL